MLPPYSLEQTIEKTVREEWGRILANLVKTLRDIQLAEDSLQDAVEAAIIHWQKQGLPKSPAGWLVTAARRKAIDRIRRAKTFAQKQSEISYLADLENTACETPELEIIPDKRLEMIFTCCHPALAEKTQTALTLRTIGGLTTEEIARAFLDSPIAMAQRLVRAKKKIKLAGIPYEIPGADALSERIRGVLAVIYLIFNEGYAASSGPSLVRADLIEEAIRLGRIVGHLMPKETEVSGLLALMLLHDSRRHARQNTDAQMIPLDQQNRAQWDKNKAHEGIALLKKTLSRQRIGPYQIQASISALHVEARSWAQTDWPQIATLYNLLYSIQPSPVVRINQAMAVSHAISVDAALTMMDEVSETADITSYQAYYIAKSDLMKRAGKSEDAKALLAHAITLASNDIDRAFLQQKLTHLSNG